MRRQAIVNVGSNWATLIVTAVVSFVLAPLIVRVLGNEAYGVWVLIGSLIGYLGLVDLGVRGAVTKFVATSHAAGNHAEAGRFTAAGLVFFGIAAAIAVLVGSVVALFVDRMFDIPPELVPQARLALFLTCIAVAVSIVGGVFGGVIVALHRFDYLNGVEIAVTLARTVAIVVALERGGGLVALAVIQLVSAVARTWIYFRNMRSLYPELHIRLAGAWALVPQVVAFGAVSTVIHVSTALINYSDSMIIGVFQPLAGRHVLRDRRHAGAPGARRHLWHLAGPGSDGWIARGPRGDRSRSAGCCSSSARLATLAILPIAVAFALRGVDVHRALDGRRVRRTGGLACSASSPRASGVYASFQVCTSVMMGINRHRGLVPAFLIEAVANVSLCVALIRPAGHHGSRAGNPAAASRDLSGVRPLVRASGVRYAGARLLVAGDPRPALAVLPFAVVCEALEVWWPAASLWVFFAQIALLLPLAALGAWVVALDPPERAMVVGGLESRWRSFRGRRQPIPDEGGPSK